MEPLSEAQRRSLDSLMEYDLGPRGEAYLRSRGLLDAAAGLGLREVPYAPAKAEHRRYAGRLVIPSFSARGTVVDMALRCMEDHDCGEVGCPKYLFTPGVPKRLYGLDDLHAAQDEIHIAEGHPDRMTLKACGLHAVGVAGVQAWKPYHRRLFQGFERVYYWAQSDDKGQSEALGEKIQQGIRRLGVILVVGNQDVNSYYQKHGKQAVLDLIPRGEEGEVADERDDDAPPF